MPLCFLCRASERQGDLSAVLGSSSKGGCAPARSQPGLRLLAVGVQSINPVDLAELGALKIAVSADDCRTEAQQCNT